MGHSRQETRPPAPEEARAAQWQKALALYESLHRAAEADEWEWVEAHEAERRVRLEQLLATPLTAADAPRLRQLQHHNDAIRDLAAKQRDAATEILEKLRSKHKAASAYLQQAGRG